MWSTLVPHVVTNGTGRGRSINSAVVVQFIDPKKTAVEERHLLQN